MGLTAARRVRVLCVDDEQQLVNTLARLLKAMGHEAHVAYDGATALGAARTLRPEIVLLDVGLPQTDGYDLIRQVRERERQAGLRPLPAIAATAYARAADRQRALLAGYQLHIAKPVEPGELVAAIASLLRVTVVG